MPVIKEVTDGINYESKRDKMEYHWNNYKINGSKNKQKHPHLGLMARKEVTSVNPSIFRIGDTDRFYGFSDKVRSNKELGPPKLKKHKTICKLIFTNLDNYFDKSTLHGLRYVGDNTLTAVERIFWLLSFLTAIAFAAYFINIIYAKFNNSPVIISFSPTAVSVSEIPFPAITICSVNVVKKEQGERILQSGTDTEKILLDDYCDTNYTAGKTSEDIDNVGDWETLKSFILNVTQSCPEMLKICKWKRKERNCSDIFNAILTDDGYCCTFNRLPSNYIFRNPKDLNDLNETYPNNVHDWTPEKGYNSSVPIDALPLRSAGAGAHLGLSLVLDAQVDGYYCQTTNSLGFKVLLSNPIETPKMADFGFFLRPGIEARIVVNPKKIDSTSTLQGIEVVKRQCFFSSERYLQFYRTYTEKNCMLECQANKTLALCNCVPYFLPKNRTTRICGKRQDNCVQKVKAQMEKPSLAPDCHCLPACFELSYEKSNSYNTLSVKAKPRDDVLKTDNVEYFVQNMAIVHFYYNDNSFTKRIKSEIYGFSEFLSNTGGLLGLFLGFSFLSAVEIGYYLIIKTLVKLFKRHQNRNKVKDVKIKNGAICNCLGACSELSFKKLLWASDVSVKAKSDSLKNISPEYFTKNTLVVHFYFQKGRFTSLVKSEIYGFSQFLANAGGLLGLFLGFSFLSIVEVVYHLIRGIVMVVFTKKAANTEGATNTNNESRIPFAN